MRLIKNCEKNEKKQMFKRKCNCCKIDIQIYRNELNNNVAFYDGHFYHKQCFEDMSSIIKKCKYCGQDIILSSPNDNVLYYDNGFYHIECFTKKCEETKTKKWINASKYTEKYIEIAREKLSAQFERKKIKSVDPDICVEDAKSEIRDWFEKSDVNQFILENYNIQILPPNFYVRYLKPLYDGTSPKVPGLKISPSDLLDMWTQKMNTLIKIRQKNINKGKIMSDEQTIAYDLAVLISKYNSYLDWKTKQLILQSDNLQKHNKSGSLDVNIIKEVSRKSVSENEEISDLVDDIFN